VAILVLQSQEKEDKGKGKGKAGGLYFEKGLRKQPPEKEIRDTRISNLQIDIACPGRRAHHHINRHKDRAFQQSRRKDKMKKKKLL